MANALKFNFKNSRIPKADVEKYSKKLEAYRKHLMKVIEKNDHWQDEASILLPSDRKALKKVRDVIEEKKKLKPEYVVVCGIGGSNLGTIAIQEAVLGKLYNQKTSKTKVLYADTVDPDSVTDMMHILEAALRKKKNIILNVVSKSGSTTETIANFQVMLDLLKKHKKNYHECVVCTTGRGSKLWNLAKEKRFSTLEIPTKVGGRYSVFSRVGLFPLGMLDLYLWNLLKGAQSMR